MYITVLLKSKSQNTINTVKEVHDISSYTNVGVSAGSKNKALGFTGKHLSLVTNVQ